jgi:hypothetical protein
MKLKSFLQQLLAERERILAATDVQAINQT